MRVLSLSALALFACLAFISSCRRDLTLRISAERCFLLTYSQIGTEDPHSLFAEDVALEPGTDSGEVRSGASARDTSGFWRMFLLGAHWQRDSADLVLHFSNGFSAVVYRFRPTDGDTLKGQLQFLYDVVDQQPPPAPVVATRIRCEGAHFQSPQKVAA